MELELHPAALIYPDMPPWKYAEVLASIRENGQDEPIVVLGNQIVDGRHRWLMCKELGREVKTRPLPDGIDPFVYADVKNGHRRDETTRKARREAVVKALKTNHKRSNPSIADEAGVDEATVRTIRAELVAGSEIPNLEEKRVGKDGKSYPARRAKKDTKPAKATKRPDLKDKPTAEEALEVLEWMIDHWESVKAVQLIGRWQISATNHAVCFDFLPILCYKLRGHLIWGSPNIPL